VLLALSIAGLQRPGENSLLTLSASACGSRERHRSRVFSGPNWAPFLGRAKDLAPRD
jgi:hypothetical protein